MNHLFLRLGLYWSTGLLTLFTIIVSVLVTMTVLLFSDERFTLSSLQIAVIISLIIAPSMSFLFLRQYFKIHSLEQQVRQLAMYDELTDFLTRRFFMEMANNYLSVAERSRDCFSLITFDIDHFKKINDTYGHLAGDKVLKNVADTCLQHKRKGDLAGRLGGEEFALLLPEMSAAGVVEFVEELRLLIQNTPCDIGNETIYCTASLGYLSISKQSQTLSVLLDIADKAMYQAKAKGRNRSELAEMPDEQVLEKVA